LSSLRCQHSPNRFPQVRAGRTACGAARCRRAVTPLAM